MSARFAVGLVRGSMYIHALPGSPGSRAFGAARVPSERTAVKKTLFLTVDPSLIRH